MKTVTISLERYKSLLKTEARMGALEIWGVDNWQGYGECFDDDYRERIKEINTLEDSEEYCGQDKVDKSSVS
jgi:hypothetical protein